MFCHRERSEVRVGTLEEPPNEEELLEWLWGKQPLGTCT